MIRSTCSRAFVPISLLLKLLPSQLVQHILSLGLLILSELDYFLAQSIFSHISEIQSDYVSLWRLGDFLDETYINEDVMNALAKITYFACGASSQLLYSSLSHNAPATF